MKSVKTILTVVLLLSVAFVLTGTSCNAVKNIKSKIAGTVYIDGRPQAFGTVQAWKDGGLVNQERCTDSGHFVLADLDPGTYTLVYLNARGAPIGGETIVECRMGRFETVDLQLTIQGIQ